MSIQNAAREIRYALKPTARIRLLDIPFIVPASSRGAWEEEDFATLRDMARGCRCVLDVGAYRGFTALLMRSVMPDSAELWAFDPSPDACDAIRAAASLQGWESSLRAVDAFVSARSGQVVEFAQQGANVFNSSVRHAEAGGQVIYKTTVSLDDFCAARSLHPDLVKIDVEGAEMDVLAGTSRVLTEDRPRLMVEVHRTPSLTVREHASSVANQLAPYGYAVTWLRTGERVEDASGLERLESRCHLIAESAAGHGATRSVEMTRSSQ